LLDVRIQYALTALLGIVCLSWRACDRTSWGATITRGNAVMQGIELGLVGEETTTVVNALLATHLGSGPVRVYATPAMVALMESAAVAAIAPSLPEGQASVGVAVDVRHVAATPPGQQVRARAEIVRVDGRKVTFKVEAWDEHELIGEGTHTRYVIDVARFIARVQSKSQSSTSFCLARGEERGKAD
jgi:predicted thioesterase